MIKGEAFCLEKHAGADAEFFAQGVAMLNASIEVISDDWVSRVEEMAADLMVAAGLGCGFDYGEIMPEGAEDAKVSASGAGGGVGSFLDGLGAAPFFLSRATVDNGPVCF